MVRFYFVSVIIHLNNSSTKKIKTRTIYKKKKRKRSINVHQQLHHPNSLNYVEHLNHLVRQVTNTFFVFLYPKTKKELVKLKQINYC
jgi:hypothetical protein